MPYNLRSSSKMDHDHKHSPMDRNTENSSVPPWLEQLQLQLQQQHDQHQRDIELLRKELQEHRIASPTPDKLTPARIEPGTLIERSAAESMSSVSSLSLHTSVNGSGDVAECQSTLGIVTSAVNTPSSATI